MEETGDMKSVISPLHYWKTITQRSRGQPRLLPHVCEFDHEYASRGRHPVEIRKREPLAGPTPGWGRQISPRSSIFSLATPEDHLRVRDCLDLATRARHRAASVRPIRILDAVVLVAFAHQARQTKQPQEANPAVIAMLAADVSIIGHRSLAGRRRIGRWRGGWLPVSGQG